ARYRHELGDFNLLGVRPVAPKDHYELLLHATPPSLERCSSRKARSLARGSVSEHHSRKREGFLTTRVSLPPRLHLQSVHMRGKLAAVLGILCGPIVGGGAYLLLESKGI